MPGLPLIKVASGSYDFLIAGAGVFGLSTAVELGSRGFRVAVFNQGGLPDPLSASADISKVVRLEYGSDLEYMQMAAQAIIKWRQWNEEYHSKLYHECGFLIMSPNPLDDPKSSFERHSLANLKKLGFSPSLLDRTIIQDRYKAFADSDYQHGFYHEIGGFAEASKTLLFLADKARNLGVDVFADEPILKIEKQKNRFAAIATARRRYQAAELIVCSGNHTPYLLPELAPYFKITGHPVFHVKPTDPSLFEPSNCPVFAADTSNSGWYGFPMHPGEGVVKIGLHSNGKPLDPRSDVRQVSDKHMRLFKTFLMRQLPTLAHDPIVHTRLCCYTDTLDGHYWIDQHPHIKGLTVASGGSGHGFKMAPIVGEMIANVALGAAHQWSSRYQWRELSSDTPHNEEARFIIE